MKNIILKFVCVLTMFMGITCCSPNLNEEDFLRNMSGNYSLTVTGVQFITRELAGYVTEPIGEGTGLEMVGDGTLNIILMPASITPPVPAVKKKIAQFVRLELEDQGLYLLERANTYIARSNRYNP